MESLWIASIVLIACLVGAGAGFYLRRFLPESHLSGDSKDVVKQGFGLIATMVALVLGLLVATAKSSFDAEAAGFEQLSTNIIVLDRAFANYGPEAQPSREKLKHAIASMAESLWPTSGPKHELVIDSTDVTKGGRELFAAIRELAPKDDTQRAIKTQAIALGTELAKTRWSLSQPGEPLLPTPFLVVMIFWLGVLFASYGLFTPRTATVIATLVICAVSLAGAIFLVVDLGEPTTGLIQVSGVSLRYALSQLGQ